MSAEQVALIPQCAECGDFWPRDDEERWRAYLDGRRGCHSVEGGTARKRVNAYLPIARRTDGTQSRAG
jgi:hypothetical protein